MGDHFSDAIAYTMKEYMHEQYGNSIKVSKEMYKEVSNGITNLVRDLSPAQILANEILKEEGICP